MVGLAAAKRRGRQNGHPLMIDTEILERITAALDGEASKASVCRTFKVTSLDANRHTSPDRLDRTSEDLIRSHQAVCRKSTTLSRIGCAASLILSDML